MPRFFLAVFQVAVIIALPLFIGRIFRLALHKLAHKEFSQVPILTAVANLQGILAGIVLMQLNLDSRYFDIEQIFVSNGPWNITLPQFLWERANLFLYSPIPLFSLLMEIRSEGGIIASLILVVFPMLVLVIAALLWGQGK